MPKEDEEPPITREVTYEERYSSGRKNVIRTELMQFKPYTEETKVARGDEYQIVINALKKKRLQEKPSLAHQLIVKNFIAGKILELLQVFVLPQANFQVKCLSINP